MQTGFSVAAVAAAIMYSSSVSALDQSQLDALQAKLSASSAERKASATAGYAQLIGFVSDASVSGYVLDVGNAQGSTINIVKLPLDHELAAFDAIKLSVRGSFNYASVEGRNLLQGIASDVIKPNSEAYSGLAGLLLAVPLSPYWTLKPALDIGIGRIENSIAFAGADAVQARPLVESLVVNWSTNMVLVNTGLGLDYTRAFGNYTLTAKANYNHTLISSFGETNRFAGFTEQTDLLHFLFDLSRPLNLAVFGYPLTGVLHSDHTVFLGKNSNALGFTHLNAFGYRVETDLRKLDWKVQSLALGFNYVTGDRVEGYEVVFNVNF